MIQNHILYFKIPIQFLVCWEGWTTRASGENRIFKPYPGCFGLSAKICIGNSTFQSTVLLKTVSVLAFSIISCIFCVLTKYIYLFLLSSLVSVLRLSQPVNMSVYTPVCLPPNGTDFTGRNLFPFCNKMLLFFLIITKLKNYFVTGRTCFMTILCILNQKTHKVLAISLF